MVLALPDDFFKGWQWQAGDRAIIFHGKEISILGKQNEYIWYYDRGELVFSIDFIKNDIAMVHVNDLRPIPSQKQLQDMLISPKLQPHSNLWTIFRTFEDFFRSETMRFHNLGIALDDSFEMLWLKYVMQTKFKAEWRDGNWIY